jgi:hypothetical protein
VYLLAVAVRNGGRLAPFDRGIPIAAVRGAEPRHLVVILSKASVAPVAQDNVIMGDAPARALMAI